MSDDSLDDAELRRAIRQATRRLQQKSEAERRVLIQQAVEQALDEELAEKRAEIEREAEEVREELARDTRQEEAMRARRKAPATILLLVMLLLILLLIATATGRGDILRFPGARGPADAAPTLQPRIESSGQSNPQLAISNSNPRGTNPGDIPAIGSLAAPTPEIGAMFRDYYLQHGGERIFGRPISPPLQVNGRTIQWFERARLEEWPEHAGTPYAIQGGRLGAEFTRGLTFPTQTYFVSRPGLRYFAETGHGVRDRFLQFWEQNGGLDILGYPISDEVQELLPDRQIYTVQYFERGRLEYHPQQAGTPFEVQIGLLGRALYLNESKPNIIPPPKPTPVPLP